ncbi:MAG: sugar transferase [Leptolinea sp.]|jgi:exopolysaccharide biosynthesis polyprenyl glycosylphosphotransferase|nr:sugar transferase [Leptolinea sp.]
MNIPKSLRPLRWRLKTPERRLILFLGDLSVSWIGLFISLYFWSKRDQWFNFSLEFILDRPAEWFYLLPFIWLLLILELYDVRRSSRILDTIRGVAIAAGISFVIYFFVFFISEPKSLPRTGVAAFIIAVSILTILWRLLYIKIFTAPQFLRRVIIVGAGRAGSNLVRALFTVKPLPFFIVGFVDDDPGKQGTTIEKIPVLGNGIDLPRLLDDENISDVIFSISGQMNQTLLQNLLKAEEKGIEITTMPIVYEETLGRVPILLLQSDWILRSFVDQAHAGGFYELAKRLMDIFGGLIGTLALVLLAPFISLAIVLDSGRPVFFSQDRLGINGQIYRITKFRTMYQDAEKDGKPRMAVENDHRVTRIGRFLRKSHLDELPQFLSVLMGSMSLVGPRAERPELVDTLQEKIPFYRARLFVKPGLTGWAQVNYGYASTIEHTITKLEYDLYYIKHRSLILDVLIILRTAGAVFGLKGQ